MGDPDEHPFNFTFVGGQDDAVGIEIAQRSVDFWQPLVHVPIDVYHLEAIQTPSRGGGCHVATVDDLDDPFRPISGERDLKVANVFMGVGKYSYFHEIH